MKKIVLIMAMALVMVSGVLAQEDVIEPTPSRNCIDKCGELSSPSLLYKSDCAINENSCDGTFILTDNEKCSDTQYCCCVPQPNIQELNGKPVPEFNTVGSILAALVMVGLGIIAIKHK